MLKPTAREYIRMHPWNGEGSQNQYGRILSDMYFNEYGVRLGWKNFADKIRSELANEMLTTSQTLDKDGNVKFSTQSLRSTEQVDTEGFEPSKITTNPYGGQWVKYEKPELDLDGAVNDLREILTKDIEPFTPPKVKGEGCTMVVFTSDKHFGAHTKENSVYTNEYNPEVFRERHDKLLDRIYKEQQRFGVFDELVYFDLGDAADGWSGNTTRGGHQLPQNLDNAGQWREYVNEHKRAIDQIVDMNPAERYRFIGASNSNHGGQFDQILMETLGLYIDLKYPYWETLITDRPFDHVKISEHSYIFGHGKDDADMRSGIPLNLNDKTENWFNDYINQKKLEGVIHVVSGDLHQSAHNYGKRFRYRKVMSLYGSSKWIHTNFGSGRPGVSYDIIDGSQVYSMDLIL